MDVGGQSSGAIPTANAQVYLAAGPKGRMMKAHLEKILYVEAAHRNPKGGEAQQRLHGHSYKVEVLAAAEPDTDVGWIVDFAELKTLFADLYAQLDHADLNTLPGMEEDATLPALRRWIESRITNAPAWFDGVRVSIIGDLCYKPVLLPAEPVSSMPERIFFTFEAAQSLPQLPGKHPCRKIHGHSYRIEAASNDLPQLRVSLGELYAALDHRFLNEVPGLEQATCERLCLWMWEFLEARGNKMYVIVVQETPTSRCVYWGE